MDYSLIKVFHIGALILWLGPAFGAWLVFKAVESESISNVTAKINRMFFAMITLEHLAFVALLISGFSMAFQANWFSSPWLHQKLFILALVIVPLEIIDIALGNWLAMKASAKKYSGYKLTFRQEKWIRIYHGPFTKLALATMPISVFGVIYLAVSKAPIF
tara:strand:- start:128 stop:610 length:483 start_codon:yes stop_codon:yes gene_type:complete